MVTELGQLLALLESGTLLEHRHSNVELKSSWSQEAGKKISANANKIHLPVAWLVVGANDAGKLLGRDSDWAKKTEAEISSHLNQYLDPSQACHFLEAQQCRGGSIVVLRISNPGVIVLWNKVAYKSSGTTIAEMEPEERMELTVSLPGLHDFSAQKAASPIDSDSVRRFTSRVAKQSKDSTFSSIEGAEPESALHRLRIKDTNAARLLFANGHFRLVFYNAAGVPQRNDTIRPLYRIFDPQTYEEIEIWAHLHQGSNERIYPPRAFQEGIANAVAHAAYFERDGEIMIEVFSDHLCVSNLCTKESAFFANRWFSRSHKTQNALLAETLRLAGHVDELGRGKSVIFNDYLSNGRYSPWVVVERTGRYSRWRLMLPGGLTNERHVRLLNQLKQHHDDEQKALIALALVLWRDKPVQEIRKHVDGEFAPIFAEVLADFRGATFYAEKEDRILLNRWASLLLDEGVDSKALSDAEEDHLYETARQFQMQIAAPHVGKQDFRVLGEFGHTKSGGAVCTKLLKKWTAEGRVQRVKRGHYRFPPLGADDKKARYGQLLDLFTDPAAGSASADGK